ncbi:hypothetical protein QWJ46_18355 [Rhizobium sp. CBN3]|uniref:hypothetical protein n=1 Tax=Rhizobium sp. CBN3 TaxID=3058045 RepID=UPI0026730C92|nr:hypothetical protein [Rhizobium sp. CBN3]MDO3434640.1 hypothetical protein [Rhizobium sp. CBN3]
MSAAWRLGQAGDSVMVLPSGMVTNGSKMVTFDLVRNAAVAGDAITLVPARQVDDHGPWSDVIVGRGGSQGCDEE